MNHKGFVFQKNEQTKHLILESQDVYVAKALEGNNTQTPTLAIRREGLSYDF